MLDARVEGLREDLRTDVTKLEPRAGDLLIIRPKIDGDMFPRSHIQFLSEMIRSMNLDRVNFIICGGRPLTDFKTVSPNGNHPIYLQGWNDAMKAILQ